MMCTVCSFNTLGTRLTGILISTKMQTSLYADKETCTMTQQLGDVINEARRAQRWSLRQLAEKVKKEDGTPISPQYLNDIELNHRSPSTYVLRELARELALDFDKLLLLA